MFTLTVTLSVIWIQDKTHCKRDIRCGSKLWDDVDGTKFAQLDWYSIAKKTPQYVPCDKSVLT
jgi:hypothetical protein